MVSDLRLPSRNTCSERAATETFHSQITDTSKKNLVPKLGHMIIIERLMDWLHDQISTVDDSMNRLFFSIGTV